VSGPALIAARLLLFAAALVLFGSSGFFLYGLQSQRQPWQRRTLLIASATALMASLAWYMLETASMTGSPADAFHGPALWSVFTDTRLGKVGALRTGLLATALLAGLALRPGRRLWSVSVLLGTATVASFAWSGHGVMNAGAAGLVHVTSDVLHLLAAGAWLGALLPLTILLVRPGPSSPQATPVIARALENFSGIGAISVSILILTGVVNSLFLLDFVHWRTTLASPYGLTLLVKLGLFAGMLALAALNRLRLAPALAARLTGSASAIDALRRLRNSIAIETLLALLVLAAVAVLGTLEPP
jgi:putative copper resistance protein D